MDELVKIAFENMCWGDLNGRIANVEDLAKKTYEPEKIIRILSAFVDESVLERIVNAADAAFQKNKEVMMNE